MPESLIDEADVRRLVRLLGDAAAVPDQARRVEFLLSGVGELIGADWWSREEDLEPRRLRGRPAARGSITGGTRTSACISFHRADPDRPFCSRELRLADIVLSEVPWLRAADPKDERKSSPARELPARQRRALQLLLAGCSRKDLASRMNVSLHTAAGYAKGLYKHFDVRSQRELMSRWLPALASLLPTFLGADGSASFNP